MGCRGRAPQEDLLRIAVSGGRVEPDVHGRLTGRGAYVHRDMACVARATRRGALARALRMRLDPVSSAEVQNSIAALLDSPDPSMNVATANPPTAHQQAVPTLTNGLTQPEPCFVDNKPHPKRW